MTPTNSPPFHLPGRRVTCPRGFRPSDLFGVGLDVSDSVALLLNAGDLQKTQSRYRAPAPCNATPFLWPPPLCLLSARSAIHCLTQRNPLLAWQGVTCNSLKHSAEAVQGDWFPGGAGEAVCQLGSASVPDTEPQNRRPCPLPGSLGLWTGPRRCIGMAFHLAGLGAFVPPLLQTEDGCLLPQFRNEHYKGSMMEGRVLCPRRSRLKLPLASSASLYLGSHLGLALLGARLLSHFSVLRVKGGGQWAALNPRSLRAQKPRITLSLPALSHEIRQRCWSRLGLRSVLYERRIF